MHTTYWEAIAYDSVVQLMIGIYSLKKLDGLYFSWVGHFDTNMVKLVEWSFSHYFYATARTKTWKVVCWQPWSECWSIWSENTILMLNWSAKRHKLSDHVPMTKQGASYVTMQADNRCKQEKARKFQTSVSSWFCCFLLKLFANDWMRFATALAISIVYGGVRLQY